MSRSKRGALLLLLGLSLFGVPGCTGASIQRSVAGEIGNTKAAVIPPLGIFFSQVRAPVGARTPTRIGPRRGVASVNQIAIPPIPGLTPSIPLFSWGDASEEEAARRGGLEKVSHLDYELTVVMMVYRRFTLIAYGD
jgi:hypothetical protein